MIAFLATARPTESLAFYRDVVGLSVVEDPPFALVFLSGETMIRIQKVDHVVAGNDTALGWDVPDLRARMAELRQRGVAFVSFDGFPQRDGIWRADDGTEVAWFRDPDGNLLSLTQFGS
ncbi:MAG: VOC family protein [Bauldia sp.]|nr:VOC family protein [Bauldia sp.]